jgi:hypothetical protein
MIAEDGCNFEHAVAVGIALEDWSYLRVAMVVFWGQLFELIEVMDEPISRYFEGYEGFITVSLPR